MRIIVGEGRMYVSDYPPWIYGVKIVCTYPTFSITHLLPAHVHMYLIPKRETLGTYNLYCQVELSTYTSTCTYVLSSYGPSYGALAGPRWDVAL